MLIKVKYMTITVLLAIIFTASLSYSQDSPRTSIFAGKKFIVYFGEDSTHITVDTAEILDKLVEHGKKNKGQKLLVTGFFHEYEMDGLAEKRADAIKKYCVMLGLPESQIITRHQKRILAQNEEGIFKDDEKIRARRAELAFIDAP